MEQPKYLISPKAAVVSLVAAGLALTAAIVAREPAPAPAPAVCEAPAPPPPSPDAAPAPAPVDDVVIVAGPPKIEGVKASAQLGALGVDLQLDVAVALAG